MSEPAAKPFFSVIIPTYNREGMIGRAVEHVLNQTFGDFELIVVDDGSTDNSQTVLKAYEDTRLRIVHQNNSGRSVARNRGIENATGRYICFQDSDDIWEANHLSNLYEVASQYSEPLFLFTHLIWRYPDKDVLRNMPDPSHYDTSAMYCVNEEISTITVCISAPIFNEFHFDPDLVINEDLHLWARISSKYPIQRVNSNQAIAYQHDGNTRLVIKDSISPRIEATEKIFSDPVCKNQFTQSFKRERLMGLRHQYIYWLGSVGKTFKQSLKIVQFILLYPENPQNKSKLVMLLYNLPLIGNLLSEGKQD